MTDFAKHIQTVVPDVQEAELPVRVLLLKGRDYCEKIKMQTQSPIAYDLAHNAYEIAKANAFAANTSLDHLNKVLHLVRRITQAAMQADILDIEVAA